MEKPNIEALRRRVETERAATKSGRVKFSPELKQDIVALVGHPDWGPTRVTRALSLSDSALHRWRQEASGKPEPKMTPVVVTPDKDKSETRLVLEFPNGAKVSGLKLQDLERLLGGLK